jgi:SAM-dependent methyltransferase
MIYHDGKKSPRHIFSLDVVTPLRIQGWVYDPEDPETFQGVVAIFNSEITIETVANQYRPDLVKGGLGPCAFDIWIDAKRLSSVTKTIEVRLTSGELLFSSGLWMGSIENGISTNDEMYQGNYDHYYRVGAEAADIVDEFAPDIIKSILDLPCGHGRVARHLRGRYPRSQLVCCDIDRDGVDFCKSNFDAKGVYSNSELNLHFDQRFDVIWVGSLLTHFPESYAIKFLNWSFGLLAPSGTLFVTSHGDFVRDRLSTENYGVSEKAIVTIQEGLLRYGYGYSDYPGQQNYGISIVSRNWFESIIEKSPTVKISAYLKQRWDSHQDVLIIRKNA